jgi:hypothetical protein
MQTLVDEDKTLRSALNLIWANWNGFKHVWDAHGYPFVGQPELNDHMLLYPSLRILFLTRRNLLKRFMSHYICLHTNFWTGPKGTFERRLKRAHIRPLHPKQVSEQIKRDVAFIRHCVSYLEMHGLYYKRLLYEDILSEPNGTVELSFINDVLQFLGYETISLEAFAEWGQSIDFNNRWASPDVYSRIPGIRDIEDEVGCDETGWVFR